MVFLSSSVQGFVQRGWGFPSDLLIIPSSKQEAALFSLCIVIRDTEAM